MTPKDIQSARLELQSLVSFSERHLPDVSSLVAQEIQKVILSVNRTIQDSEAKLRAAALLDSSNSSDEKRIQDDKCTSNADVPLYLHPLVTSTDLRLPLETPVEALALFCHSILLNYEGIVCIAEKSDGGVPGFAAPLAPLPPNTFVPPAWNKKKDKITFLYKHKAVPGKKITLEVSSASSTSTLIKIGFKTATSKLVELTLVNEEQLNVSGINRCSIPGHLTQLFSNPNALATLVSSSILQALPFLVKEQEKARQRELEKSLEHIPMEVTRDLPPSFLQQSHIHRVAPPPPRATTPSVGLSDAHPPLPTVVPPPQPGFGPQGQLPSLYDERYHIPYAGGTGTGGMLIGPDHPIFQGGVGVFPGVEGRGGAPGFGPGMPQPRYDPIINPDIFTDPHVAPAGGGVGGRGRGRGRGRGAPRVPGEPAPDHLKPPDFGDSI